MSRSNFEQLEKRRMMAAGPAPEDWVINGTDGADIITITQTGNVVTVNNNGVVSTHAATSYYTPGPSPSEQIGIPGLKEIIIHGLDGNDQVMANNSVQVPLEVWGGDGIDTIKGGGKDDLLMGPQFRKPNEIITNPSEYFADLIEGNNGNDQIGAAKLAWNSTLNGNGGNDTIWGADGPDFIDAGLGNDNIVSSKGSDKVTAGPAVVNGYVIIDNDNVDSGEGNDTVDGGVGSDMLITGPGSDSVYGGSGNDRIYLSDGYDTGFGGTGNDGIYCGEQDDKAFGQDGKDTLQGHGGKDSLYGGNNDDKVEGGAGADSLDGGAGFDEVSYFAATQPVTVNLTGAGLNGAPGENDTLSATFEAARGGIKGDTLIGNAFANKLFGEGGDDIIRAGAGNDTIEAGFGDDRIWGQDGDDSIDAGQSNDELFGGKGLDTLLGGYGRDRLVSLGGGADRVNGGLQQDIFVCGVEDTIEDYNKYPSDKDVLHKVEYFSNYVSTELDGQNLTDPSLSGLEAFYGKCFDNIPLFHKPGPQKQDIVQGSLGDCYFLSGLCGIANSPKDGFIENNIVDLGDGSYMVKFMKGASPRWYRVDNQLPIKNKTFDEVAFAKPVSALGEASMWVPIMEKAFAIHRTGTPKYEEIVGDNDWTDPGMPYEAYDAFGLWHDTDEVIWNAEEDYALKMRNFLLTGGSVTASTDPPWLGCDITAFHVYTVLNVSPDLKTVTIRNPWATDDSAFKSGANDGVFTVSISQFDDDFFFISYSNL